MNAIYGVAIVSALLYWIYFDGTYFKIFLCTLIGYTLLTQIGTLTRHNTMRKKCTIATWNGPNSPQIYVSIEWDITKAQAYLEKKRKETSQPLTLTHLVGYAVAQAMSKQPDINGRISFGNVLSEWIIMRVVLSEGHDGRIIPRGYGQRKGIGNAGNEYGIGLGRIYHRKRRREAHRGDMRRTRNLQQAHPLPQRYVAARYTFFRQAAQEPHRCARLRSYLVPPRLL